MIAPDNKPWSWTRPDAEPVCDGELFADPVDVPVAGALAEGLALPVAFALFDVELVHLSTTNCTTSGVASVRYPVA